jgi:hypothetical protein
MRALAAVILALASGASCAMEVQLSTEVQTSSRPTIQGTTNLPDGTKLTVIVSRKESAYRDQASTAVSSGRFSIGPLSQRGNELNPGLYKLEVATIPAIEQPLSVQQLIGKRGEKLHGPLISREAGGQTVRYSTAFQIGVTANPELDRIALDRARMSTTKWWKKQCTDICDNAERFERDHGRGFSPTDCLKTCITNPPTVTR